MLASHALGSVPSAMRCALLCCLSRPRASMTCSASKMSCAMQSARTTNLIWKSDADWYTSMRAELMHPRKRSCLSISDRCAPCGVLCDNFGEMLIKLHTHEIPTRYTAPDVSMVTCSPAFCMASHNATLSGCASGSPPVSTMCLAPDASARATMPAMSRRSPRGRHDDSGSSHHAQRSGHPVARMK